MNYLFAKLQKPKQFYKQKLIFILIENILPQIVGIFKKYYYICALIIENMKQIKFIVILQNNQISTVTESYYEQNAKHSKVLFAGEYKDCKKFVVSYFKQN